MSRGCIAVRVSVGILVSARENLQASGEIFFPDLRVKKRSLRWKKITRNSLNCKINAGENSRSLISDDLFPLPLSPRNREGTGIKEDPDASDAAGSRMKFTTSCFAPLSREGFRFDTTNEPRPTETPVNQR